MKKKALVAMATLAVMFYSVSAFAAAGTCQDWKGLWEFTYDNATSTTFCFDNKTAIDNASLILCVDNASIADNCTCISGIDPDNASLGIDNSTVPYEECDNNSEAGCIFVKNPVYKKLSVAKGKYQVIITDAIEGDDPRLTCIASISPNACMATCMATGKRGTQDITITAPDNATLNNAYYNKYYPNVAKGSYIVQEGAGQSLMTVAQTRVLNSKFKSDNFTAESPYWNIPGLVSGKFVRELTCDDLDNCTEEKDCVLNIVPKKIFMLLSFINPIVPFVISAERDGDIEFSRPIVIDWGTDAINDLIRIRIGKRIIFGLMLKRPLKLESDNYTVTVTYGDNDTEECGTIEVK
jgi:hypothetical protein